MPHESDEENKANPAAVPPVTTGTQPTAPGGGTTTQPDGAHDPYDDPGTAK
ncbi:hypothetical protein [Amycolatopsis sp. NPDC051903]|uniref:hypothetical protein n=1 Tax=Amycolatopsis sp. NPDC051903 TaxID=3363936 RepID=UPI0037B883B3